MEPFPIFCSFLVIYCGYLTFIDLTGGRQGSLAPVPTGRRGAQRERRRG